MVLAISTVAAVSSRMVMTRLMVRSSALIRSSFFTASPPKVTESTPARPMIWLRTESTLLGSCSLTRNDAGRALGSTFWIRVGEPANICLYSS